MRLGAWRRGRVADREEGGSTVTVDPDLGSFVGASVARIRRVFYVFRGDVESDTGPVELGFDDGRFLLVDGHGDGERVRLGVDEWLDPFAVDDLDAVNRRFVEKHGKWTAFDVTDEPPYGRLAGAEVTSIRFLLSDRGRSVGVVVDTSGGSLVAEVECDDLRVEVRSSDVGGAEDGA